MEISKKQRQFLELIEDPEITELFGGGSAGGSKTVCMGLAIVILARKYPGARFFVGRKTLKSLRQSTINTLISKVHPLLGLHADEWAMHWQQMELEYKNGSVVIFGELEKKPGDPDFARVGSLEIDIAFIDEAGEITLEAKNAIKSRVGRGVMTEKYGIPGKLVLMANPSMNFLRQEYYDPYKKLGEGGFQKWKIGEITLNEGKENERVVPSYRAFLRMGAYDNPFLSQSYIDNLKSLPERERKRLLNGDWNYTDEDNSLFKSGLLDKAITYDLPPRSENFDSFIGVDISDKGSDRSVFTLIRNGTVISQYVSKVQMNWQKESEKPLGNLLADELIQFAQRNGFAPRFAKHIAIECNGVGVGCRDFMKTKGWYIYEYVATSKSRSEGYYQTMLDMDSGALKLYHSIDDLDGLRRELSAHSYEMENQEPKVIKKSALKETLGFSPDRADSLMIANRIRYLSENPELDPRTNRNRLGV